MWASDNENTDRRDQTVTKGRRRAECKPHYESYDGDKNDGWHKPGRDMIRQPLNGEHIALRPRPSASMRD